MRGTALAACAGFLLLATSPSFAQRPAAPQVTVGANLKELVFDWEPVPDAFTYWLLEKTSDRSYYATIGERIPGSRTRTTLPIAVHLQNWERNQNGEQQRYIVAACNTEGCTRSAEIVPSDLMLASIGYVKASNTGANDAFGGEVVMSADGSTMAVSAPAESSNATGVNGNQASNTSVRSGAVYVYRRSGRDWAQEAYLKAAVNQPEQSFGAGVQGQRAIAISADGSWLAVGAPSQDTSFPDAGVVYMFNRTGSTWTLATTLNAPLPGPQDFYGGSVDISQDGRTLKVTSQPGAELLTHIYERPDDTWQLAVTLAPFHSGDRCDSVLMSSNGDTLIQSCTVPSGAARVATMRRAGQGWVRQADVPAQPLAFSRPMAINHHGMLLAVFEGDRITMYRWENDAWLGEVGILANSSPYEPGFGGWGQSIAFDTQGNHLAISDTTSSAAGAGVSHNVVAGTETNGAVYLYQRMEFEPRWFMRTFVKASNPGLNDQFGFSVALSGNGRILAVGATAEDSAARGIDGNQASNSAPDSGAVYLY